MTTLRLPTIPDDDAPAPSRPSKHELARFIAGELDAGRAREITALLANDAALKARHDDLVNEQRAADAALKLEVPLERFLHDHAERTTSPLAKLLRSMSFKAGLGVVVAGAAAVLFTIHPADPVYDGLKGGARVGFFVKDVHDAHFGKDGEELSEGNQIQFAVRDDAARSAMVLVGVDGRGEVTVYDAEQIDHERAKGDSKTRLLPDSVILDDSTGAERFYVVYGDGDVDAVRVKVEGAAKELAARHPNLLDAERLPLDDSYVQSSVHIVKVAK